MTPERGRSGAERRTTPLLAVLVASVAVVAQLRVGAHADGAWLLYAADRVRQGAEPGTDLLEINPPPAVWAHLPAAWLGAVTGVPLWTVWVLLVTGLALLAVRLCARTLDDASGRSMFGWIVFAALVVVPVREYGQREHVAAVLLLPWVALAVRRARGCEVPRLVAAFVGVLAAAAVGLKPHFGLAAAGALVAAIAVRRRATPFLPEVSAAGISVGAIAAAVVIAAPHWWRFAVEMGPLYVRDFLVRPLWGVAIGEDGRGLFVLGSLALALLTKRAWAGSEGAPRTWVLVGVTIGAYLAVLAQHKGFGYHFVPAHAFAVMLLGACLLGLPATRVRAGLDVLMSRAAMTAFLVATLATSSLAVVHRAAFGSSDRYRVDLYAAPVERLLRSAGPGTGVAVLSIALQTSWPLVLDTGTSWCLRLPHLWPLAAYFPDGTVGVQDELTGLRHVASPTAPRFMQLMHQDFQRRPPEVVVVPQLHEAPRGSRWTVDYRRIFADDLAPYREFALVGPYWVLVRQDSDVDTRMQPALEAAQRDAALLLSTPNNNGQEIVSSNGWLALFALAFGAGLFRARRAGSPP